jgi:hypothetical protein
MVSLTPYLVISYNQQQRGWHTKSRSGRHNPTTLVILTRKITAHKLARPSAYSGSSWQYKVRWRLGYVDASNNCNVFFFSLALQPPWALASAFQFHDHFTAGRTPWTGDQPVARSLPTHRTTQTQNKHIHTPNIRAFCGIRTHDLGFRASEDSTCLRPLGYRDRRNVCSIAK